MLDRLVENGFDFLIKAVEELEKAPKFSVIHFHAAVELFLKARLMHEHWSLVISSRQEADWEKFKSGDFQSVSLNDAAKRLDKIVRSGLNEFELRSFREITSHRNKVVHFFHEAHTDEENKEQLRDIVKQQLTAWYYLHQLLTKRWKTVFAKWEVKVIEINKRLKTLHQFLQVTYEQLKPQIENRIAAGEGFKACPSCGFKSQVFESEKKVVHDADCLVCDLSERILFIECPACESEVTFVNDGFGKCSKCGESFEPEDLGEVLIDGGAAFIAATEGDNSWDMGNCGYCDGYHTVVRTESNLYICTSCFATVDFVEYCEWCGDPNTGDMTDSFVTGCNHCEGRLGNLKDD